MHNNNNNNNNNSVVHAAAPPCVHRQGPSHFPQPTVPAHCPSPRALTKTQDHCTDQRQLDSTIVQFRSRTAMGYYKGTAAVPAPAFHGRPLPLGTASEHQSRLGVSEPSIVEESLW